MKSGLMQEQVYTLQFLIGGAEICSQERSRELSEIWVYQKNISTGHDYQPMI